VGGQQSYSMHNSLLGLELGATLVILMLAVLACLLDQRLSVETAKSRYCAKAKSASAPWCKTHLILSLVAADGSIATSLSVKQILGYEPELAGKRLLNSSILTILPRQRTS